MQIYKYRKGKNCKSRQRKQLKASIIMKILTDKEKLFFSSNVFAKILVFEKSLFFIQLPLYDILLGLLSKRGETKKVPYISSRICDPRTI